MLVDLGVHVADARRRPAPGPGRSSRPGPAAARTNSRAICAAIRPAPTTPTLVTGRASDLSGAPAGRLARFCTRSNAYSPARSSSDSSRSARASSSAANPSSRVAVRAAATRSSARYGAGAAPCSLPSARKRAAATAASHSSRRGGQLERRGHGNRARQHPARPSAATPRGSRRARTSRPRCPARTPRAAQHLVLRQRVLDDHLQRAGRPDQPGQQVGAAPAGHQAEEALGQRDHRHAGGDRPVGAVQRDLEAAAERHAVDEPERRHGQLPQPPEHRVAERRDAERPLRAPPPGPRPPPRSRAAAPSRSAPAARMNGLPVTPTAAISPAATRAATASSAAFSDSSPRAPNVFGLVWSCPLSSVISAMTPAPLPVRQRPGRRRGRSPESPPHREARSAAGRKPRTFWICSSQILSQSTVPPMPMPTHIVVSP